MSEGAPKGTPQGTSLDTNVLNVEIVKEAQEDKPTQVFFSSGEIKEPSINLEISGTEDADVGWDDDMDGGNVVAVNYLEFEAVEQSLYDRVKAAVVKHQRFLEAGIIPFSEALAPLKDYRRLNYEPAPGTVVEAVDERLLSWKACVVANTYQVIDNHDDNGATVQAMTTITRDSSLSQGNDTDEVRPVCEAVMATFGETPWYFMQRQLLVAEEQMRFERFHVFDFEEVRWKMWISERIYYFVGQRPDPESGMWVDVGKEKKDPRNRTFQRHFSNQSQGAKEALCDFISEPFELMDDISNEWFEDSTQRVSCYVYLSFLGQDWFFPLISLTIQFLIPWVLFVNGYNIQKSRVECDDDDVDDAHCLQDFWCPQRTGSDAWMGRTMITCVILFYLANVVPVQIATLLESIGDADDAMSKLHKLRKVVHDEDEDEYLQKIGFRINGIMNTSYHCALFTLNIFLLFWTDDVVEIILNALAIEFIKDIDEIIASSGWYDGSDYRYLKAGAFEMLIRRYVSFHVLDKELKVALNDAKSKVKTAPWGTKNRKKDLIRETKVQVNDSAKNIKADNQTLLLTRSPKVCFFTWQTKLLSWAKIWAQAPGCMGVCGRGLMLFVRPFKTRGIFDKWSGKYLHGHGFNRAWNRLIYAKHTYPGSTGPLDWLSVERTSARLAAVEGIKTKEEWATLIGNTEDKRDKALYRQWCKSLAYEEPKFSYTVLQITRDLFPFNELLAQLTNVFTSGSAFGSAFTPVQKSMKSLFYVLFAFAGMVSMAIQLIFPPCFVILLIYMPVCY